MKFGAEGPCGVEVKLESELVTGYFVGAKQGLDTFELKFLGTNLATRGCVRWLRSAASRGPAFLPRIAGGRRSSSAKLAAFGALSVIVFQETQVIRR